MSNLFAKWISCKNDKIQLQTGAVAPDFALYNEKNELWRLSDYCGQVVALLFYPGDETLVCTRQMCAVRDYWTNYLATKAVIVGVSPGTSEAHQRFARKHHLPLPLLADANRSVTRIYASHTWMPIWWTRAVVIIDANGIVRSRTILLRAFREPDHKVIAAIYRARADFSLEKYDEMAQKLRAKIGENKKAAEF